MLPRTVAFFSLAAAILWLPVSLCADGSAGEKAWISLFDGFTLDGWARRCGFATYAVVDGAIVGTAAEGSGPSFLCTTREFADFELLFEVMVDESLPSGVQVRSQLLRTSEQGREYGFGGRLSGPLVEIRSSPGPSGWINGESAGLGWLSPEPRSQDPAAHQHRHFRNGEWNQFRIIAQGARLQTFVNGTPITDLTHPDILQHHTSGLIGLQVGSVAPGSKPFQVRWRRLQIRELP